MYVVLCVSICSLALSMRSTYIFPRPIPHTILIYQYRAKEPFVKYPKIPKYPKETHNERQDTCMGKYGQVYKAAKLDLPTTKKKGIPTRLTQGKFNPTMVAWEIRRNLNDSSLPSILHRIWRRNGFPLPLPLIPICRVYLRLFFFFFWRWGMLKRWGNWDW